MIVKCDCCEQEFEKETRRVNEARKNGWKIFCSKECKSKIKSKKILCNCAHCEAEIQKTPSEIKRSKTGNVFCNKSCAASYNNSHFKTGENNPNYKHGEGTNYTNLAFKNYKPFCTMCGHTSRATLQVHHIDENRLNNSIENLIILCANCHCEIHYGNTKITKEIIDSKHYL